MYYVDPIIKDFYRYGQPEGRWPYIRLDQNENPDGLPRWVYDEMLQRLSPAYLAMYPEEEVFIEKYSRRLGIKKENITLTDGSVVAMGYVIKVFGEPGKKILCATPTFGMYKVYAEMAGMSSEFIHYEDDYSFDANKMIDAITDEIGIVSVVNPNMPIGNVYSRDDIIKIVEKAAKHNAIVVIDEAYHYFYEETCLDLIDKYDNVIILRTFSKMFSMAGLRMGAVISNPEIVQYIKNYKPHYTINCVALLVGEIIIDNYDKVLKELKDKFRAGKEWIEKALTDNGYRYVPSEACFLCIYPKNKTAEYITDELKKKNILIFCGKGDSAGFLRLTVWDKKYMEMFMKELLNIDV